LWLGRCSSPLSLCSGKIRFSYSKLTNPMQTHATYSFDWVILKQGDWVSTLWDTQAQADPYMPSISFVASQAEQQTVWLSLLLRLLFIPLYNGDCHWAKTHAAAIVSSHQGMHAWVTQRTLERLRLSCSSSSSSTLRFLGSIVVPFESNGGKIRLETRQMVEALPFHSLCVQFASQTCN